MIAPHRSLAGSAAALAALAALLWSLSPAVAGRHRGERERERSAAARGKHPRTPRPPEREDELAREKVSSRHRLGWWLRQRAFPGSIPPGAHAAAQRAFAALPRPFRGASVRDSAAGWVELGPAPLTPPVETPNSGPITGRMRAVAIDPQSPQTLYAGAAQGGAWKSTDGGATWKPLTDGQPALAVGAIALDPAAPGTVYVGTGESLFGFYGDGLLKSTDGGQSFTRPAGDQFAGQAIVRIVVARGAIYLATTTGSAGRGDYCTSYYDGAPDFGLWRSGDGGRSFVKLIGGHVFDLQVDASQDPPLLYYSIDGAGAFKMVDGGQPVPLGLPTAQSNPPSSAIALAVSPSNPQVVYAGLALGTNNARAQVYVSQDAGATFNPVASTPNYCYDQCDYTNALAVDPTDPGTLWVAGGLCSVFRVSGVIAGAPAWRAVSSPGGSCDTTNFSNWFLHYVHPDGHALVFAPDGRTLYAVSDGGLVRTSNGGSSWQALNDGVGVVQFYGICVDPADPSRVIGGAQDNGSMLHATTGLSGWSGLISGDGGPCIAAAQTSGTMHEVISDTEGSVMVPGANGYDTTFDAYAGFCQQGDPGCGDRVAFIAPLVGDPSDPQVVLVGTHRLWRSAQGGATGSWTAVSNDLTRGVNGVGCLDGTRQDDYLTAIAVAPSDGKTIYTGSAGGRLSVTRDGGASWTAITEASLPSRWVSSIAIDAADPTMVYAAFSGFSTNTKGQPGHVFASTDAGVTWRAADVPVDAPVNTLVAHPVARGVLYAGTDVGVLVTVNDGASWQPLDGLPGAAVYSLVFHAQSVSLFAGTHGRGVWQRSFPASLSAQPTPVVLKVTFDAQNPPSATAQIQVQPADPTGSVLQFSAAPDQSWLQVKPGAGRAAGPQAVAVTLTASSAGLQVGEYDAHVALSDPRAVNTPLAVPVHLSVVAPPRGCGCALGERSSSAPLAAALLGVGVLLALARRRRR